MNTVDTKKPKGDRLYPEHDFKTLLAAIGSDKDVAALIESYGYEAPPLASIRGWRSRNSIPSRWVPLLVGWAMHKGGMKTPEALIVKPF